MERYQETLRHTNPKHTVPKNLQTGSGDVSTGNDIFTEEHQNHSHIPVSWGKVNSHTLAPLLNAYEETITEKNEILEQYELELSKFTCKLKEVVGENEALHRRLTEDKRCSKKLCEELEAIRAELKSAKEQNDVLIKKCALKQDKVEEILKCYERKGNYFACAKMIVFTAIDVKSSSCSGIIELYTRSTAKAEPRLLL